MHDTAVELEPATSTSATDATFVRTTFAKSLQLRQKRLQPIEWSIPISLIFKRDKGNSEVKDGIWYDVPLKNGSYSFRAQIE